MTLTKPVQPDRSKIHAQNPEEIRAWAKNLNVSPAELIKAIDTVGNSAAEVRKELESSRLGRSVSCVNSAENPIMNGRNFRPP
jgi:hypothetical protein